MCFTRQKCWQLELVFDYLLLDLMPVSTSEGWLQVDKQPRKKHQHRAPTSFNGRERERERDRGLNLPGEHFVQKNANTPPISSLVMAFAHNNLRCHVFCCSTH
uniref:Secreted protein n=1 Tax=Opuntia streptacantha TaxID=393608 RepID=A0A7C9EU42_OPUST